MREIINILIIVRKDVSRDIGETSRREGAASLNSHLNSLFNDHSNNHHNNYHYNTQ